MGGARDAQEYKLATHTPHASGNLETSKIPNLHLTVVGVFFLFAFSPFCILLLLCGSDHV